MAFRQQNQRFPGRYNTTGQFVSGGQTFPQTPNKQNQAPQNVEPAPPNEEEDMNTESDTQSVSMASDDGFKRPHWMKSKLFGVKKITNRERRRRQNETLRRLLTPKNALMVLYEMMPNEQVTHQFKVEPAMNAPYNTYKPNVHSFCADLALEGQIYKGFGENKMMARNAAAEQAIRDIIIKKMHKTINSDSESVQGEEEPIEETLPMIQLASFALHKLFSEWEFEGHKVPQLKTNPQQEVEPAPVKQKELPVNASSMHPCMLLTYMRPHVEYREVSAEGDRPQNMVFTIAVNVDGCSYIGKAQNKKEARKAAAKAACMEMFNVQFDPNPTSNTPLASN